VGVTTEELIAYLRQQRERLMQTAPGYTHYPREIRADIELFGEIADKLAAQLGEPQP